MIKRRFGIWFSFLRFFVELRDSAQALDDFLNLPRPCRHCRQSGYRFALFASVGRFTG
jgi:hypothetical protein